MSSYTLSNRWSCIHQLIKQEKTGSLREFAKRVGISKSQLNRELTEMKSMGAPIEYNPVRKTYHYCQKVEFRFEFTLLDINSLGQVHGGRNNIFKNIFDCPTIWDNIDLILHHKLQI